MVMEVAGYGIGYGIDFESGRLSILQDVCLLLKVRGRNITPLRQGAGRVENWRGRSVKHRAAQGTPATSATRTTATTMPAITPPLRSPKACWSLHLLLRSAVPQPHSWP